MKNTPLVSVIMPVYQSENFLEYSINSILNQTCKDFEFLIVYDESSDNSLSIIKKFQQKDKRILIIYGNGKNLIDAINKGIVMSRGKFIARMDADDVSLPKRFENQINHMNKNNLDICGCHCFLIDRFNKTKSTSLFPITHEMCFLSLAFRVPFAHSSVMIRKKIMIDKNLMYGQSDFKTAEDFDLWIRMYNKGAKFGNVDDILHKYRDLKNSLSKIKNKEVIKDTKKLVNEFFEKEKKNLEKILEIKKIALNTEEQILLVKLVFKNFFKTLNFNFLKHLKNINIKAIFFGFLSEIKRIINFSINN
ncbi:glycosyltransferase [Candidatus Pelagibacter sp.]|nr:glycosyltransferase [Candidatus Pelagibacter sp.]